MGDDFSDAPLTVDGVTVKPKWAWPKDYREHVRKTMQATSRSDLPPGEVINRYTQWYAEKHGISTDEARRRIKEMARP